MEVFPPKISRNRPIPNQCELRKEVKFFASMNTATGAPAVKELAVDGKFLHIN
jgi:hypothetical protein